eukprot:1963044-Rhodomonas_salina.3
MNLSSDPSWMHREISVLRIAGFRTRLSATSTAFCSFSMTSARMRAHGKGYDSARTTQRPLHLRRRCSSEATSTPKKTEFTFSRACAALSVGAGGLLRARLTGVRWKLLSAFRSLDAFSSCPSETRTAHGSSKLSPSTPSTYSRSSACVWPSALLTHHLGRPDPGLSLRRAELDLCQRLEVAEVRRIPDERLPVFEKDCHRLAVRKQRADLVLRLLPRADSHDVGVEARVSAQAPELLDERRAVERDADPEVETVHRLREGVAHPTLVDEDEDAREVEEVDVLEPRAQVFDDVPFGARLALSGPGLARAGAEGNRPTEHPRVQALVERERAGVHDDRKRVLSRRCCLGLPSELLLAQLQLRLPQARVLFAVRAHYFHPPLPPLRPEQVEHQHVCLGQEPRLRLQLARRRLRLAHRRLLSQLLLEYRRQVVGGDRALALV